MQRVGINWRVWMRKSHRWGAILIALPFLLVILTGILLQIKKEWSWIQPLTVKGQSTTPTISLDMMLAAAQSQTVAEITTWDDVDRVDVQPGKGMAKVQAQNGWEVQVDLTTGDVLQVAYRRSDVIEALHDGSWFHERARLWFFLPMAIVVFGLWLTGIYLFFLPINVRRARRREKAQRAAARIGESIDM